MSCFKNIFQESIYEVLNPKLSLLTIIWFKHLNVRSVYLPVLEVCRNEHAMPIVSNFTTASAAKREWRANASLSSTFTVYTL